MAWVLRFYRSSVGGKFVVALTGLALFGFVVGHLVGNLLLFAGRDAMNSYAGYLKSLGALLWVVRGGLLLVFVAHIVTVIRLHTLNRAARPVRYAHEATVQASLASRYMILSGAVVLAYVIYHLLHFTFGIVGAEGFALVERLQSSSGELIRERHDVYGMVIHGFSNPWIVSSYVVANILLAWHLYHGIASVAQTLGLRDERYSPLVEKGGVALSFLIGAGFLALPLAVYFGVIE